MQEVILVDDKDNEMGVEEKMKAHREALLHRAFSVFIFNKKGEMLLQQRAKEKYHSGGLWSNTCCSHPQPGEQTEKAAVRRLEEELGFQTKLDKQFDFIYKASFDNGLTEHEFDHVYTGVYDGPVVFNKEEVMDICYKSMQDIADSMIAQPNKFTAWFHIAFPKIWNWYKDNKTMQNK